MKLFAKHETDFITRQLENSDRQTYHINSKDKDRKVYAFSSIRMGCKVPDDVTEDDYLFGPQRKYRNHSTERKSHNWEL